MSEGMALVAAAAGIGLFHALLGPDHYLPLVALGRARRWPLSKTLLVSLACGVGHVAASAALGLAALGLGWSLLRIDRLETFRGELAGWLLLGFGVAYTAWGVRSALRDRPHSHLHVHEDGTVHRHPHRHRAAHAHPHLDPGAPSGGRRNLAPWTLFVLFVLGPCEPLIPLLLYPAARQSWGLVAAVAGVFALTTVATMAVLVGLLFLGLTRVPAAARLERWTHAAAGLTLVACALALRAGF